MGESALAHRIAARAAALEFANDYTRSHGDHLRVVLDDSTVFGRTQPHLRDGRNAPLSDAKIAANRLFGRVLRRRCPPSGSGERDSMPRWETVLSSEVEC